MNTTRFVGPSPLSNIPDDASEGIVFIKNFLSALNTLNPEEFDSLQNLLRPDAIFLNNNIPAISIDDVIRKLTKRATHLTELTTTITTIWDIVPDESNGTNSQHTVMVESTSKFVFKDDPENPIVIADFSVIELEKAEDGKGFNGLWVVQQRAWADASPIRQRRAELAEKLARSS